jgi:hypothetical protein
VRLSEDKSREVVNFLQGIPKRLRFDGVTVMDCATEAAVFLTGPVDLVKWCLLKFSGTKPDGSGSWQRTGYALHTVLEDGVTVDKAWNLVAVKARQQLRADLETGSYLVFEYKVTQQGFAPELTYSIERTPPAI